ncbi:hypothetical protein SprV_0200752200 [Sparganum proliferum]
MVRQLHDGTMVHVMNNGPISEAFVVTNGVKQGCALAPTLFRLVLSAMLMDAYSDERPRIRIANRVDGHLLNSRRMQARTRLSKTTAHHLFFVDDSALNATTEKDTCPRQIMKLRWQDRIPDTDVPERTGVLSIYAMLRQLQLRWSGHLVRMDDEQLPKRHFYGDVATGCLRQGDQVRRYKKFLKVSLKPLEINPANLGGIARVRPTWRRTVKTGAAIYEANRIIAAQFKRETRKS